MRPSPQIEESEDEDPDQVDEMPVEAGGFDDLVQLLAAGEEALAFHVEIAAKDLPRHDDEKDHADRDMGAVEAGDHEEGRAELRRPPGIAPRPHPFHDELRPFEGLHADEGGAEH